MKYKKIFIILIPVILIIAACPTGTLPGATTNYSFSVLFSGDSASYDKTTSTLDFGPVKAGSAGSEVTGTISNDGDTAFSVTAIALGDSAGSYSLTIPTLPYTIEPGKTADFSLAFIPESSGVIPTTLKISYADADSVTVNITGEGNYAPVAQFGIDVSDSGYSGVDGFYVKDGTYGSTPPLVYKKSGTTDYYIYFVSNDAGNYWGVDSALETSPPSFCYIGPLSIDHSWLYPPEYDTSGGWVANIEAAPVVETGITMDTGNGILKANYHYSDSEGDAESGTSFQWYRNDTADGTYTAIPSETTSQYTIKPTDYGYYFKVEVTPVDAKGMVGDTVTSDPYYVELPPQP